MLDQPSVSKIPFAIFSPLPLAKWKRDETEQEYST